MGSELGSVPFNAMVFGAPSSELRGVDFEGSAVPDSWENLPEESTFLFSQASEFPTGEGVFVSNQSAGGAFVGIEMRAMTGGPAEALPIRITINDSVVFNGTSPFDDEEPDTVRWWYRDSGGIQEGENTILIENRAEEGAAGQAPWLLIDYVTVYYR